MARTIKLYKLPDEPLTPGLRPLVRTDVPQVPPSGLERQCRAWQLQELLWDVVWGCLWCGVHLVGAPIAMSALCRQQRFAGESGHSCGTTGHVCRLSNGSAVANVAGWHPWVAAGSYMPTACRMAAAVET